MKKIILFSALFCTAFIVRAQKINDPNVEVREAKNFHGISLSHAFDVYLTQSNEEAVAVSAATEKDRAMIKVEVKNGILHVGLDQKGLKLGGGKKNFRAYISFVQIDQLSISGACDVYLTGTLKGDELSISQSGASDLKEAKVLVNKLTVDLSGASDMRVTGKAGQAHIEASGASSFRGFELSTDHCNVKASGASDIKITVNREISAQATGASDIRYRGDASLRDLHSSGASSVSKGR